MTYQDPVKTDWESFGNREMSKAIDLLNAWKENKTTKYFQSFWYDEKVKPAFNINSGFVFLTNEEYQAAMIHNGKLDIFESCGEDGHEGFPDEFKDLQCEGCKEIYKRFQEVEN